MPPPRWIPACAGMTVVQGSPRGEEIRPEVWQGLSKVRYCAGMGLRKKADVGAGRPGMGSRRHGNDGDGGRFANRPYMPPVSSCDFGKALVWRGCRWRQFVGWRGVGPARPGWAAGRVQTQILNRLGLGMPASRILSKGRFIQTLSALGVVPGSRERRRLGRSFLLIDLGYAGAYSQMYLP